MSDDEKHSKWEDLAKEADDTQPAGEDAAPAPEDISEEETLVDFQKVLEEAQTQAEDYKNKLMRVHAELENVQRRAQQDLSKAHKFIVHHLPYRANKLSRFFRWQALTADFG